MSDVSASQKGKTWLITGSSSGFGRLLSEHLITLGANVVATARNVDSVKDLQNCAPQQVLALPLDVTRPEDVDSAVAEATRRFGRVDVLVNNAGYGVTGAVEEVTEAEYMPMFETNVFGAIRLTKALLPQFRSQRSGAIVFLSSIGGLVGLPGWGYYNATKFALEGFGEALGAELAPLGVHVLIVEPGPFRTEFLGRSGKAAERQISEYAQTAGKTREYFDTQSGKQAGDPQKAVEAIVAALDSPQPPRHLLLGKLALDRFRTKTKTFQDEAAHWESTTLGADFDSE